ncbi:unnamed protein product [Prunus armeniaca]
MWWNIWKTNSKSVKLREDWRQRSRPMPPGGTYPAKDHWLGTCSSWTPAEVLADKSIPSFVWTMGREGLDKFLKAASSEPETVLHYEFMQNYKVHLKHLDGHIEEVPYFSLPANELVDVLLLLVIDIPLDIKKEHQELNRTSNLEDKISVDDLVVGYMGVPKYSGISMTQHPQYVTGIGPPLDGIKNRNVYHFAVLDCYRSSEFLEDSQNICCLPLFLQSCFSGKGPDPAPKFVGNVIAFLLNLIGPKGLEFACYSLDYHTIRNYLADQHMPSYAKKIVDTYNKNGEINRILSNK